MAWTIEVDPAARCELAKFSLSASATGATFIDKRRAGCRFLTPRFDQEFFFDFLADVSGKDAVGGGLGTRVILTGLSYLLSAPDAESIPHPINPPATMLPKVAPAEPE